MNKKYLLSVIILLVISVLIYLAYSFVENPDQEFTPPYKEAIWKSRIAAALEPSECKKVAGPRYGQTYYNGHLIDTHYHIDSIPDSEPGNQEEENKMKEDFLKKANEMNRGVLGLNIKVADIVCTLEQENTQKAFVFFPVYPEIYTYHIEVVKKTMEKYPDKFVPFIMPPDSDDSLFGSPTVNNEMLKKMLAVYPNLFKGYGEIGLYTRLPLGARALPPDSKRLRDIYPVIRQNKLAVYFHLAHGQKESFETILSENPDINFIFHGDQLIPGKQDDIQDLSNIENIIANHPNAFYTVDELYGDQWMIKPEKTKEEFLNYLKDYKNLLEFDLKNWKGIIERHPDQFLWGTDRSDQVLWSHDPEVGQALTNYARAFIAGLAPSVQEKFAYKNAEHLLKK